MENNCAISSLEREIFDEEGIFSAPDIFEDPECKCDKCMYCGFDIERGEEKIIVDATGDILHRRCWQDYAEDNFFDLCHTLNNN